MKYILIGLIRVYQLLPFHTHSMCKFTPTCSNYSIEAIKEYGSIKGTLLTIKRILRCNPFSKGGYDPIKKELIMKKLKYLLLVVLFCLTGCFKANSMDEIKIATSVYPIEYVVKTLYGDHSSVASIYPHDSNILDFKVTKVLLKDYSTNDLFIFNGLTEERDYVKSMKKYNNELMIIDATANIIYDYSIEELWLDPNNLLTIANNIKNGFEEYIDANYLVNEINQNYETLKIDLTGLDGKFYSSVKNAKTKSIIVTDDAFKFLEKYGLQVISLDEDTINQKNISDAIELIENGTCDYIFVKYKEELSKTVNDVLEKTGASTLEFYTLTNLHELNIEKNNYITLMNNNLENMRIELYK